MACTVPISGQGCLAVLDGGHAAWLLGDLEALWEGPLWGTVMRMGTIGWKLGEDIFLLLVRRGNFLQACYWLCTAEDPLATPKSGS